MKRLLVLIITLILIFSFTACSNPSSELNEPTTKHAKRAKRTK